MTSPVENGETMGMSESAAHGRGSMWPGIVEQLAQAIGRGDYPPGQRLPSEHELADLFGVNRHTVRRALAELMHNGLVRSARGSGTFVEEFAVDLVLGRRTRHRASLTQAGMRGGLRVLAQDIVSASSAPDAARALGVRAGSRLLRLRVLGEGQGQPLHVSERWFPLPRFKGLAEHVIGSGSITQAFQACGIDDYTRRESRLSAQMPAADVAEHLRQPLARPVLRVTSLNVDREGTPIEFANAWFAGDRVTLTVRHDDES